MGEGGINICYVGENKRRKNKFEYFGNTVKNGGGNSDTTPSIYVLACIYLCLSKDLSLAIL